MEEIKTKICSKCNKEKPLSEYHKRSNRPCGVRSQCKQCYKDYPTKLKRRDNYMREYDLFKSYKISLEEYEKMLKEQNNSCKICESHIDNLKDKRKKNFCVDHCHTTGKIRGLLCDSCNKAIGFFNDDISLLKKAILYSSKK